MVFRNSLTFSSASPSTIPSPLAFTGLVATTRYSRITRAGNTSPTPDSIRAVASRWKRRRVSVASIRMLVSTSSGSAIVVLVDDVA